MGFNSFQFADEVSSSLIGNLDTLARGNLTLQNWTNDTADLNKAWQTGPSPQTNAINAIQNSDELAAFLNGNLNDANQFCTQDMTTLLSKISAYGDFGSGGSGPTQMSMVQTFGNLISATQQIQTSTGDTTVKAEAGFLQQSTSAQQTESDMGNSGIGILSAAASMLMQSFL